MSVNAKEHYYQKHVVFPVNASFEEKVDMASRLVPSLQQLTWHKMEQTAFLHFGINTFTGREWGDGSEDPMLFNPTSLDAEQWIKTLHDTGFKMVILTAKHHDGFCLWPTSTTKHSVASSPWKSGNGDVVKDLKDACDKYGMKFGVYLSPWDRNAKSYGDSEAYNKFFCEQLTELLSNYGDIYEVWFDGACGEGKNGKKQVYDWDKYYSIITKLQPNAVMAIMGDDIRWVGNETGLGRETEWAATALCPGIYSRSSEQNGKLGLTEKSKDLGGRSILKNANELFWYPSEVDVSIRPGWFYHKNQDSEVKSLSKLVNIAFQSIGYNSSLLLNIPPDTRGLINEADVKRLKEFSDYWRKLFSVNHVKDSEAYKVLKNGASTIYDVDSKPINTILIQEDISKGQRMEKFSIDGYQNGRWKRLCTGTTVGYKRLIRILENKFEKLRLNVEMSRNSVNICKFGAFYAEAIIEETMAVDESKFINPIYCLTKGASKVVDGDISSTYKSKNMDPIIFDMKSEQSVSGFVYYPTGNEDKSGTIYNFNVYISNDGKQWDKVKCIGEFSNIMHNPIPQTIPFKNVNKGRYIKIEPLTTIDFGKYITIGEIKLLK